METAYIETTIPSFYVSRPAKRLSIRTQQESTQKWWDGGCSGLRLVTSAETFREARRGDPEMAAARVKLISGIGVLDVTPEVAALARALVSKRIVPESVQSDAIHIAIASVYKVDYLVTWNFTHIANPFIRERIRNLVNDSGFTMPVMCSPSQMLLGNEPSIE